MTSQLILLSQHAIFYFVLKAVYIVNRDACTYGLLVKVGKVKICGGC